LPPTDADPYRTRPTMLKSEWSALEYADKVLSKHSNEVPIADGMRSSYLEQVRALID
jgi:hypothetical protein